ncbi:MAG: PQQ-binding-like beta-propeller repeat protein, partial [Acidobacteriota bacterium]|nr:PQQ-binding-like beta-propeller repeat protein [Acidobacteriota bacterium]
MARSRMARISHRERVGVFVLITVLAGFGAAAAQQGVDGEWRVHGGDAGYTRYAALDQIDAETVGDLQIVWRREAVDASLRERWPELRYSNQLRATPIMVDGVLYASNGIGLVEAFDPGTGETIWVQDAAFLGEETPRGAPNRGVAWWESEDERRLFAIRPPYLMAVDAGTGELIDSFGDAGLVDLTYDAEPGYSGTSPPLVVKDVVILGSAMADHPFTMEQHPGDVRAYDVRTGALRWTWSPIPRAGESGVETWLDESWEYSGMSNVWTMFSADLELGYVYLPTGAPTNDMYGGHRPGNNLYANSLVCVDAETGERVWHYQLVHHGLWDYDIPA